MTERDLRNRFIIAWTMVSALWLAGLSIYLGLTRPAPGFAVVAPLAFGVPAVLLVVGIAALLHRHWRNRT